MDSEALKVEALCWLRFTKKMELIATEAGNWNADVLGVGDQFSIEIEVKVSKSDLKREFQNKTAKHFLYNNAERGPGQHVPNYFYFYVPATLEKEALALIDEHKSKAGLAVYGDLAGEVMDGKRTRIAKRPGKLHDRKPSDRLKRAVLLRMGSELCGRYVANRELRNRIFKALEELALHVTEKVRGLASPLDWLDL